MVLIIKIIEIGICLQCTILLQYINNSTGVRIFQWFKKLLLEWHFYYWCIEREINKLTCNCLNIINTTRHYERWVNNIVLIQTIKAVFKTVQVTTIDFLQIENLL